MIYLNDKPVLPTKFPDGTTQVWKLDESMLTKSSFGITWNFEKEEELIHIAQLKELLDTKHKNTYLEINYLPYARQDKEVSNSSTFALRTLAKIINSLNFESVSILDPHSTVATNLINNSHAVYPVVEVEDVFDDYRYDIVCYPDKGASSKYENIYLEFPFVFANKVRDQLTGEIKELKLEGDVLNKKVLIVDDICDGGATFIELTKKLKESGAKSVSLFVTYGLFTKGIKILKYNGIDKIFTYKGEVNESNVTS